MIPFNKPYLTGKETHYLEEVISNGRLAGNGVVTKKCHTRLSREYGFENCLLTSSATAALEMAAILSEIQSGDEVILPSFTFVSTATPFAARGANLVFVDSQKNHPNMDIDSVEALITDRTKVIVVMHYAGMACDMDRVMEIAEENSILVVEDAAHSIGATYKEKSLGTIGHLGILSFHETKNISSGQGGLLIVNDQRLLKRAEIIWDRGTNRKEFEKGNIPSYSWVDHGANFYPSEVTAAFLLAQLEERKFIDQERKRVWNFYADALKGLEKNGYQLPSLNENQSNNHHIFYLICPTQEKRDSLIEHLKSKGILSVFHYTPLHRSPFIIRTTEKKQELPNSVSFSNRLVRLPLFVELSPEELERIVLAVNEII